MPQPQRSLSPAFALAGAAVLFLSACGGTEPSQPDHRYVAFVEGAAGQEYQSEVTVCGRDGSSGVSLVALFINRTVGGRERLAEDALIRQTFGSTDSWVTGMAVMAVRRSGAGDLTFTIERDGEPVASRRLGGNDTKLVLEASCHADGEP